MPGVERHCKDLVHVGMLQQTVGECLLSTAEDLGAVGRDNDYGVGLLQTSECHDCLMDVCSTRPVPCPHPQVPAPSPDPSCPSLMQWPLFFPSLY
jgi:hypothetical protein